MHNRQFAWAYNGKKKKDADDFFAILFFIFVSKQQEFFILHVFFDCLFIYCVILLFKKRYAVL